jgi:hypothetical protein
MTYNHICQPCPPARTKYNLYSERSIPTRILRPWSKLCSMKALGGLTGSKVRAMAKRRNGVLDELTFVKI